MTARTQPDRIDFATFYRDHFLPEHRHPANIVLHVAGTLAGLGLLVASMTVIPIWWALAFPVVHAAPGLIGHRLFERNEAVGDVRVLRTDFPAYWFIAANHILTVRLLVRRGL